MGGREHPRPLHPRWCEGRFLSDPLRPTRKGRLERGGPFSSASPNALPFGGAASTHGRWRSVAFIHCTVERSRTSSVRIGPGSLQPRRQVDRAVATDQQFCDPIGDRRAPTRGAAACRTGWSRRSGPCTKGGSADTPRPLLSARLALCGLVRVSACSALLSLRRYDDLEQCPRGWLYLPHRIQYRLRSLACSPDQSFAGGVWPAT